MLQNSGPKRPGKLVPTILMTLIGALRTTQGRNWDERHGSGSVEIFLRNFILLRWESSLQKWNFYHTPLPTTRHNTVVSYSSTISTTYVVRWRRNIHTKKYLHRVFINLLLWPTKLRSFWPNFWPTKLRSILKPLLLRVVLIPKLNKIDISRQ